MNTLLNGQINGIVDNHLHLNACKNPADIVKNFTDNGGKYLLEVITHPNEAPVSLTLKNQFPETIHLAFGIYPGYLKPKNTLHISELKYWLPTASEGISLFDEFIEIHKDKIEVIGEIGYDVYNLTDRQSLSSTLKMQDTLLAHMIEYAISANKPIMFHLRGADNNDFSVYKRALSILKEFKIYTIEDHKVYFHSYTVHTHKIAKALADSGFFIGLNGIITYPSAKKILETLRYFKWEQILFETDSPFLTPKKGKQLFGHNIPHNTLVIQEFVSALFENQ